MPSPEPGPDEIRIDVKAAALNFADSLIIAHKYQLKPRVSVLSRFRSCRRGHRPLPGQRVSDFSLKGDQGHCHHGLWRLQRTSCRGSIPGTPLFQTQWISRLRPVFQSRMGRAMSDLLRRTHRLRQVRRCWCMALRAEWDLTAVEISRRRPVLGSSRPRAPTRNARSPGTTVRTRRSTIRKVAFRDQVKALTNGAGADVIYDPVGGDVFDQSLRCVNWGGRILVVGFASGTNSQTSRPTLLLVKSCAAIGVFWSSHRRREPMARCAKTTKQLFQVVGRRPARAAGRSTLRFRGRRSRSAHALIAKGRRQDCDRDSSAIDNSGAMPRLRSAAMRRMLG